MVDVPTLAKEGTRGTTRVLGQLRRSLHWPLDCAHFPSRPRKKAADSDCRRHLSRDHSQEEGRQVPHYSELAMVLAKELTGDPVPLSHRAPEVDLEEVRTDHHSCPRPCGRAVVQEADETAPDLERRYLAHLYWRVASLGQLSSEARGRDYLNLVRSVHLQWSMKL